MKVSVIIPIKNRAGLIGETLANIFRQTLQPYEIIVVDDQSTDNLQHALAPFADKIIFLKSKGIGPGAARNTGYRASTGAYIQFFDSDDLMTRNKLSEQSNLLTSNDKAGFVYGPYVKAAFVGNSWQQKDVFMQYYPMNHAGDLSANVLEGWCSITQACLFRRELLDEVGPWRTDLMPHEDKELWYRIGLSTSCFLHENNTCVIYRQHELQITDKSTQLLERALDGIKAYELIDAQKKKSYSMHTNMLFYGYRARSKMFVNGTLNNSLQPLTTLELVSSYYYLLHNKIQRLQTGTPWGKMFGVLNSTHLFKEVVKEI